MEILTGTTTDRELWERAASGGEYEAFGQLFDRHARAVYNYLFRRTASWSEAEDLTSVVFLQAWRRRSQVVLDRDSALPWLLRVADYTARNQRRSRRRYDRALTRVGVPPDEPDPADRVARRVDDERAMREIRAAMRSLSGAQRRVVELCLWSGLDERAAAVALGVPVGTVKSRLSRARQRLRDRLALGGITGEEYR